MPTLQTRTPAARAELKETPKQRQNDRSLQPRLDAPAGRDERSRVRGTRLPARELETFTRNLATQLDAGVPLLRALSVQAAEATTLGSIVDGLVASLQGGTGFSEALEEFPRVFPVVYRRLIASAEVSGNMPGVLIELADFLDWRESIKSLLRKASIYPITVMCASAGLIAFILGFVFPKFAPLFDKLGNDLPAAAALLMTAGDFISGHWPWLLVGVAGLVVGVLLLMRSTIGARLLLTFLSRLPVIGKTLWAIDLSRFARNLAVTSRAGIGIVHGLELTKDAVTNRHLRAGLDAVHDDIIGGESLTTAMERQELFEPMVLNMIAIGEESGRVPMVLFRMAELQDRRAKEAVARMLALLEPAITVFLGLVVGGIAVTVIGTLYKAMGVAGK